MVGYLVNSRRLSTPLILVCLLAAGCTSVVSLIPPIYDELAVGPYDETPINVDRVTQIKRAFLATPDFDERVRTVTLLENQVETLMEQPLRLGSIGSAILDHYRASLAGHRALAAFYRHVDAVDQAAVHDTWANAIGDAIAADADGTLKHPYSALSANEAKAFLSLRGQTPVGFTYDGTREHPFLLVVSARPENGRVENILFDLGDLYTTIAASVVRKPSTVFPAGPPETCESLELCNEFNPWAFIHILARGADSAAQTFIGRKLEGWDGLEEAAWWLYLATRSGNGTANLVLARVSWKLSREAEDEARRDIYEARAEREFLAAIRAGFDDAMLDLGRLYLDGAYGTEKIPTGLSLMRQAAEFGNVEALVDLGSLHSLGIVVAQDLDLAESYLVRAAERDEYAKVQYARFLMLPHVSRGFNKRAYRWLREVANNENAGAMVLIGDLYARGMYVGKSPRRAMSWFKNAVKTAPDDPGLINEVAWRLTVTHLPKLRDERYALEIMERIMEANEAARRNPQYLDTWAAAYAANGDFKRAITVQEKAVEQATSIDDRDLDILVKHLEAFRAGEQISEQVP